MSGIQQKSRKFDFVQIGSSFKCDIKIKSLFFCFFLVFESLQTKSMFCSFLKFAKKYLIFFLANSKMLKNRYGVISVSDMNPRKTCMVSLLYPAQNGTNEKCYGSVFGSVLYRNHGSES